MRRAALLALTLVLGAPLAAQAQRPSNSMHTRSIENYLREVRNTAHPEDRRTAFQNALEVGVEGMERDASNPKLWFLLGQVHAEMGDLLKADSAFDRAESLYPEYAAEIAPMRESAWVQAYNTGVRNLQGGDEAAAMEAFQNAAMIFDGRPEALISLAALRNNAGQHAEAIAAYREALEIVHDPAVAEMSEEIRTQWAESEEIATFNLARLLANREEYLEAAELFEEFSARNPGNVQAQVNTALMYTQAGRAEDATRIYSALLGMSGLDEIDFLNIGIGLYRADRHEQAAEAFAKSVAANPYSRDAVFNLGQAQFAYANELLEAGDTAGALDVYTALGETAEQLLAIDPGTQPGYMMLAQSQRTRADLGNEPSLRQAALATLQKANALPFRVESVRMELEDGTATLTGSVINGETLEAGTEARLQVILVDRSGAELATKAVAVPLGAAGEAAAFDVEIPVTGEVAGWKYTITH